jgi:Flagellar-associated PapD-like
MFEGDYPDLGYDGDNSKDLRDAYFEEQHFDSDDDDQDTKFLKGLVKVRDAAVKNRGSAVQIFEAFPAIVHFSEWNVTDGCKQIVSVTNCSRKSQRFRIYSPASQEFAALYDKIGNLAPGMSQSITVKFSATELRYHHDTIRIEGEDSSLVIHLHGYPIANKVNFPRNVNFGNVQLCEPETQVIELFLLEVLLSILLTKALFSVCHFFVDREHDLCLFVVLMLSRVLSIYQLNSIFVSVEDFFKLFDSCGLFL